MLQALVVSGPKEDHSCESSTSMTVVHGLEPTHLIATFVKGFANIVHLTKKKVTMDQISVFSNEYHN